MGYIIEMLDITKDFPGIRANDNVTLQVEERSIHALLGENGAGKSTLMSILFGLYAPDGGMIRIRGKEVRITDPNAATQLGIGMVHQHFKLVQGFTVTEARKSTSLNSSHRTRSRMPYFALKKNTPPKLRQS